MRGVLPTEIAFAGLFGSPTPQPVSYTHLDVYKRQIVERAALDIVLIDHLHFHIDFHALPFGAVSYTHLHEIEISAILSVASARFAITCYPSSC